MGRRDGKIAPSSGGDGDIGLANPKRFANESIFLKKEMTR